MKKISKFQSRSILLAIGTTFTMATTLQAVPQPAPLVNPTGSSAVSSPSPSAASAGEGLAGLDDRAVAAELSGRGLNHLLDHYFKVNHIPDSDQQTIKTFGALRELRDPNAKISVGEKIRRVKEIAAGIDLLLASLRDPTEMVETAGILIKYGVNPDIDVIENWGEDPRTQASLKPAADAVLKLLDAAAATVRKQADALANQLNGGIGPLADRWDRLDNLASNAAYGKEMAVYFAAAARGPKDAERNKLATDAIAALAAYDNDSTGVQPRIHNMIAKLLMVSGDLTKAKETFATVAAEKSTLVPPPSPYEQHEALYFTVLCDVLDRQLPAAIADKAVLDKWNSTELVPKLKGLNVPQSDIDAAVKSTDAVEKLLRWRIHLLEGELARTLGDKEKANTAAEAVLNELRKAHPELGQRIDDQLVKRMDPAKPINDKMDSSVLIALERKALGEAFKTVDEKPDMTVLKRGIEAAQALIARRTAGGIALSDLEDAQLAIAQLQERLDDKVAAANAYLDFAVACYPTNPTKATQAFDHAGGLVFAMKKTQPNAPAGFAGLYNRFMPMAIKTPYNHVELALDWGKELLALNQFAEAITFLRMTPPNSPQYLVAKYREMLAWEGLLDTKQTPADHKKTVDGLKAAADELIKLADPPKDEYERSIAINATIDLARLARQEAKDPKLTLKILQGFDKLVEGMSVEGKTPQETAQKKANKQAMLRGALVERITANMALKQFDEAVKEVTQLLETSVGEEGITFVRLLLEQLDKEFAAADLIHNTSVMRDTARKEAQLTGYLVTYSDPKTQKNAEVSRYYYAYLAYDARIQRIAGSLVEDPAEKKKLLTAAADRFRTLQTPDMHKLYVSQPDVKKLVAGGLDATDPDWQVQTGLALTDFDLGDYAEAKKLLDPIIALKRLGTPQIAVPNAQGEQVMKDNDLYWEALYKLIKSDYEVGKSDPEAKTAAIRMLKNILLLGGIPQRWQDEFESMRAEAIPDFNPDHPTNNAPPKTFAPATAPAGK